MTPSSALLELHSKAESEKESVERGGRSEGSRQRNYLNYCANFSLATVNGKGTNRRRERRRRRRERRSRRRRSSGGQ